MDRYGGVSRLGESERGSGVGGATSGGAYPLWRTGRRGGGSWEDRINGAAPPRRRRDRRHPCTRASSLLRRLLLVLMRRTPLAHNPPRTVRMSTTLARRSLSLPPSLYPPAVDLVIVAFLTEERSFLPREGCAAFARAVRLLGTSAARGIGSSGGDSSERSALTGGSISRRHDRGGRRPRSPQQGGGRLGHLWHHDVHALAGQNAGRGIIAADDLERPERIGPHPPDVQMSLGKLGSLIIAAPVDVELGDGDIVGHGKGYRQVQGATSNKQEVLQK